MAGRAGRRCVDAVAVLGLALAVTLLWGATFTLVLIATYGPAATILSARARAQLEVDPSTQGLVNPDQWLKERGFLVGLSGDELPQIAVMLAPLMAGPLEALMSGSIRAST